MAATDEKADQAAIHAEALVAPVPTNNDDRDGDGDVKPATGLDATNLPNYDDAEAKRVLRKVDYRLVPMLMLLYLICFVDKGNIGNAKVAGMAKDLKLTDAQYNLALMIFFIPYCLFEIPSNIVLKMIRPSYWLATMLAAWGTVMTLHGIVHSAGGLIAVRFVLGLCEAGFFPAAAYLLGEWYCRFELQRRMSMLFVAASLSGAISGLLGFALELMDGIGGLEGWRWIFIIEGMFTVVVGVVLPWTLPDSPDLCSFLTPAEKLVIRQRLEQDSGTSAGHVQTGEKFQWKYLTSSLGDWRIWFTIFIFWGNTVTAYSFTYTAPTIILELGYTAAKAQLLTIPIYVTGAAFAFFIAWLADRHRIRWPFVVGPYTVALVGFLGIMATPKEKYPGVVYFWLFFIPGGTYAGVSTLVSWVSNNMSPTWKRAVGIGMCIMVGNMGGIVGTNIYLAREAPKYWTGYGISLAFLLNAICCTFVLRHVWNKDNKKRDRMSEDEIYAKYTEQELLELGDRSPLYRYVL
ncbi:hypothetical protein SBRCBS47491_007460 [Sporothrix bragantina]|uniref:Major facilitator superfamily (MFS) profile domain-containing protein n=1 Tax=Sporothrix bragantina TaxID=671064 RepID=A0ABP0CDD2_9PEZI